MSSARQMFLFILILCVGIFSTLSGIILSDISIAFILMPVWLSFIPILLYFLYCTAAGHRWALAVFVPISIVVMNSSFRSRGGDNFFIDYQSMLKFSFYCMAFLSGLSCLKITYRTIVRPPGVYLIIYGLWAAFTSIISPIPAYTFAAAFGILAWILLAAAICNRFSNREVLSILLSGISIFTVCSWFAYLFFPDFGTKWMGSSTRGIARFTGLSGTPNAVGQMAVVYLIALTTFFLERFKSHNGFHRYVILYFVIIGVLSIGMLVLSDSRGAVFALILFVLAIGFQRTRSWPAGILILFIFIFYVGSLPDPVRSFENFLVGVSRFGNVDSTLTLTGRLPTWVAVFNQFTESPILGHGYASARVVIPLIHANIWGHSVGSAHNVILQSLLEVGLIGTILLIIVFCYSIARYFQRPSYFADGIFILVLVTGMLESGISNSANVVIFFWFVSLFYNESADKNLGDRRNQPHTNLK